MIYLDSAATTLQKPLSVPFAVARAMRTASSVGRGGHAPAMAAAELAYRCREAAAALFDAQPEQVVFTMNATHGLNIALHSLLAAGDEVVISGFEHNAVVRPLHALGARVTVAGRRVFDPTDTLAAFSRAITPRTRAVICTHVSNVYGYILPIEAIARLCRERGVPLIVDASQSAGILPVQLKSWGAAFIAMPGHKGLYGPQGTGLLLCAHPVRPLLYGGSGSLSQLPDMPEELPDRAEAGTHNVCGIAGLLAGLRFVRRRGTASIFAHECALRRHLAGLLTNLPDVTVYTADAAQSGVLSFTLRGADCEDVARVLDANGICVRAGLHCAPLAHESGGTLESGTVRVSFTGYNTRRQTERLAKLLKKYPQG